MISADSTDFVAPAGTVDFDDTDNSAGCNFGKHDFPKPSSDSVCSVRR